MRTRDALLQAAVTLFSERGYAAVTMEQLVKPVRVSKTNIYYYFGTKQGVFVQAVEHLFGEVGRRLHHSGHDGLPLPECLSTLASAYLAGRTFPLAPLLRDASLLLDPAAGEAVRLAYDVHVLAVFERVMHAGLRAGELAPRDARQLSLMFLAVLDAQTPASGTAAADGTAARALHDLVTLFLNGARA